MTRYKQYIARISTAINLKDTGALLPLAYMIKRDNLINNSERVELAKIITQARFTLSDARNLKSR